MANVSACGTQPSPRAEKPTVASVAPLSSTSSAATRSASRLPIWLTWSGSLALRRVPSCVIEPLKKSEVGFSASPMFAPSTVIASPCVVAVSGSPS